MQMIFFSVFTVILELLVKESIADGRCRRENGQFAYSDKCVGNLSCKHYEDRIFVSWKPPKDELKTFDFLLIVNSVSLFGRPHLVVERHAVSTTVYTNQSSPRIVFGSDYYVTVRRRFDNNLNRYFGIGTECVKAQITTTDVTIGRVTDEDFSTHNFTYERTNNNLSPWLNLDLKNGIIGVLSLITISQAIVIFQLIRKLRRTSLIQRKSGSVHDLPRGGEESPHEMAAVVEDGIPESDAHYTGISQRQKEDNEHNYADLS